MSKSTIKTIAQEAGVSAATVSKALNDLPDISEGMKVRVREIARRQGYVLNETARSLVSGLPGSVGVILPNISCSYAAYLYSFLSQELQQVGYSVYLSLSDGRPQQESQLAEALLRRGVGALLVWSALTQQQHLQEVVANRVPLLLVGGAVHPAAENAVVCDEYTAGVLAAEALCQGGCRSAVVLNFGTAATAQYERGRGFTSYMLAHGVPVRTLNRSEQCFEGDGYQMAKSLLTSLPDGVFATDDCLAAGALAAFMENGVALPRQLQLIGFGDAAFSSFSALSLSTVAFSKEAFSRNVLERTLTLLQGAPPPATRLICPPFLIHRATTRGGTVAHN